METFKLDGQPFITLNNLLKVEGMVESGAMAKQVIGAGLVTVNGELELRKRCKIVAGSLVEFNGESVQVSE